jgi:hypothetical protein
LSDAPYLSDIGVIKRQGVIVMRYAFAALAALLASAPAAAETVALDFEPGTYTLLQDDVLTDRYVSNGILFDTSGSVADGIVTNTKIDDPNNPIAVFIFRIGNGRVVQSLDIKGGGEITVRGDTPSFTTITPSDTFQTFTQLGGSGQLFLTSNFEFSVDNAVIGAANPIPEPATWALMISGFGLAGAASRRTRRARASKASAS